MHQRQKSRHIAKKNKTKLDNTTLNKTHFHERGHKRTLTSGEQHTPNYPQSWAVLTSGEQHTPNYPQSWAVG